MPTLSRSARRSVWPACRRSPSTSMRPSSKLSSPLIDRSSVLLPEPLRPMIATTSPSPMRRSTPLSTWFWPKCLCRPSMRTNAMEFPFEPRSEVRQRIAEQEVTDGDEAVDEKGLEGGVRKHGAGLGQLGEADDRRHRSALDDLHREADRRRHRDAQRLWQHDVAHLLQPAHREAG